MIDKDTALERLAQQPELSGAMTLAQGYIDLVRQRLSSQLACIIHNAKEKPVIPVETGIYAKQHPFEWIPACAGMTAARFWPCE